MSFARTDGDVWLLDGARTPFVNYCGAFSDVSPTDLGIKAARAALTCSGVAAADIGWVICGSMAPGDCDAFSLPRHIGLYAGVPVEVSAILAQRICGSGFELFHQAVDQLTLGYAQAALLVGAESMTRNPIAAFDHRNGFKLGAPIGFKDDRWEALHDPAPDITIIRTAENLAKKYGIRCEEVDEFASFSFARAVAAQQAGWLAEEICTVSAEIFEFEGYKSHGIRLPRKIEAVAHDIHPRPSPVGAGQAALDLQGGRADRRQQFGLGRWRRRRSGGHHPVRQGV